MFYQPGCQVSLSGLGDGGGRLGLDASLAPWRWLGGLGLFDRRSRLHLRGSGGQAAGSRADLQHCVGRGNDLTRDKSSVVIRFSKQSRLMPLDLMPSGHQ